MKNRATTKDREDNRLFNINRWTVISIIALAALIVGGAGGFALGARSAKLEAQSVASVNGASITKAELYKAMVTSYGPGVLDQLITDKLVDQELKKAGATVTDADVNQEIAKLKDRFGGDAGLAQALQSSGMTMSQLTDNIRFQLKVTKILGKAVATDDVTLEKYFQEHVSDFDTRKIHARHILVATEAEAKAIKVQLDQGADFAALAKAKSTDTTNKDQGGDLGTFGHGVMDPDFEKAAFALRVNQISDPVQTQYGWHIIQVLSITGDPPTFEKSKEAVKEAVIAQGVSERYQSWIEQVKSAAKISNSLQGK